MKWNPSEVQHGYYWLLGAGLFVIVFSAFLQMVDHGLTTSKSEAILADTLREIRGAQASVAREARDPRQTTEAVLKQNLEVQKGGPKTAPSSHASKAH